MEPPLTTELLLYAYQNGIFPMAHPQENDAVYWYAPDPRAVLPLDQFHIPKNLARLVRRNPFDVVSDQDFEGVMRACARPAPGRETTWISEELIRVYCELHEQGYAHSIECRQEGKLVGGLYGVAIRGAFFGESMFHRVSNASKVALVHLVRRLRTGGFTLLDTQYPTPHLEQFGVIQIRRSRYHILLDKALEQQAIW